MVGDGTPYLEGLFLSCDNTALETSQMVPTATNDFEAPTDDDLESQNIKVINLWLHIIFYHLLLCLIIIM